MKKSDFFGLSEGVVGSDGADPDVVGDGLDQEHLEHHLEPQTGSNQGQLSYWTLDGVRYTATSNFTHPFHHPQRLMFDFCNFLPKTISLSTLLSGKRLVKQETRSLGTYWSASSIMDVF